MSGEMGRLYGRVVSMLGIARVSASSPLGGKGIRRYQVRFDEAEVRDDTQAVQQYGFASRAIVGAHALIAFLGGNRASGVLIGSNDPRYQIELAEGEVVIHDDQGQKVHLTRAGIVIDGGGKPILVRNTSKVTADTPELHCTGRITAGGNIESAARVRAATDVEIGSRGFLAHTHTNGNNGGPTGAPV